MSLVNELKRRKVFRVAAAYLVVAWLLIQVINTLLPTFNAPRWVVQTLMLLLILGFPLTLVLAWAFELTGEGVRSQSEMDVAGGTEQRSYRAAGAAALVLIMLVTGGGLWWWMNVASAPIDANSNVAVTNIDTAPALTEADVELEKSIAVLPFDDLSPAGDQEYFSDGLSEEILNKLAKVPDLFVIARTSSFFFKGQNIDMRTIGEQLGANYLLEGSVRKAGDNLRITAQLIQANNGFHLWSETFDRTKADIFAIQDEIAVEVTRALSITLGTDDFDLPGSTRSVAAYDALIRAREIFLTSADSVLGAIGFARQAIDLDPDYGQAWMTLSNLYRSIIPRLPPGQAAEYPGLAQQVLARAAELAPDMPLLQVSYAGRAIGADADWVEAERIMTEALAKFDNTEPALVSIYADFLLAAGKISDAVPVAERARRLDPLSSGPVSTLIIARIINADYDRALAECQRHAELYPDLVDFSVRLNIAWQQRDIAEYARLIRAYVADDTNPLLFSSKDFILKFIELVESNDAGYALGEVRRMMESGEYSVNQLNYLQGVANQFGDAQLQAEMAQRFRADNATSPFDWAARAEIYRQTDAFKERMERNGLADYWRTTGKWPDKCRPLDDNAFECF